MMSACIEETAESPSKFALKERISQFLRLLSDQLGCEHEQLVFNDINDVHCRDCGEDFTD